MQNKKLKLVVIISTFLMILVSAIGITYAYFSIQVTGNEETSSVKVQTAILRLIYTDTLVMEGRDIYPGWSKTKTITVENTGTVKVYYNIIWREIINTITNGELTMSMTCSSNVQGNTCYGLSDTIIPTFTSEISNIPIKDDIGIDPGERHTYTVTVTFPELSTNQNYNQGKMFRGTLNIAAGDTYITDSSLFTYTIENNEVTITGYNGTLHTYQVYDKSACVNVATSILMEEYSLNETTAQYGANELCEGRDFGGNTLSSFLEDNYIATGNYSDIGIVVYKVSDISQVVDEAQCKVGGKQLLMQGYSMDETTAQYTANELCEGREVDGLTLKKALESKIVTSEYYEALGIHDAILVKSGSLMIPSTIDGYPVTKIGDSAFYHNDITSVIFPNTLETIGYRAFDMNSLTTLVIPSSVTTIEGSAFSDNQIASLSIPNGVTSIGSWAFVTNALTSVTIPSSVTSIEHNAFYFNQLNSVTINGKGLSSEFSTYADDIWGWDYNATCVQDNDYNVQNGCISWQYAPIKRIGTDSTTGLPVVKIANEEFYDITNAIDYSSLISTNGNIYNYASNKSILLAKYNLSKTTGLQTSSTTRSDYSVPFCGSSNYYGYWYDSSTYTVKSQYGSSYNADNVYDATYNAEPNYSATFVNNSGNANYSIAYYVENYIDKLGIGTGRLLTYTEANAMTASQRLNGQYYWLGSSASYDNIIHVAPFDGFDINNFNNKDVYGTRPVIVVNTSDISS